MLDEKKQLFIQATWDGIWHGRRIKLKGEIDTLKRLRRRDDRCNLKPTQIYSCSSC